MLNLKNNPDMNHPGNLQQSMNEWYKERRRNLSQKHRKYF